LHPIAAISDPNVALLVIVIGALGIYAEFSCPGLIAPGVAGAVLVLLGFASLAADPVDWRGAALIVFAFCFFLLDAKLTSHGALTALGAVCMGFGSRLLVDSPNPRMRIHWITALAITIPFALITNFLLAVAVRARRNKMVTGPRPMLGLTGVSIEELNPTGTILVRGEYWKATAAVRIARAMPVRVTGIDGLTLRVESV
jgi:membrane-bound serine protease (ClpP class)